MDIIKCLALEIITTNYYSPLKWVVDIKVLLFVKQSVPSISVRTRRTVDTQLEGSEMGGMF